MVKYIRRQLIRIKRFSMGEVLSDPNWLDKQWKEKDLLLDHFERHGVIPVDNRGFCRHVVMDTRAHTVKTPSWPLSVWG